MTSTLCFFGRTTGEMKAILRNAMVALVLISKGDDYAALKGLLSHGKKQQRQTQPTTPIFKLTLKE
jgi:hypothetical protein